MSTATHPCIKTRLTARRVMVSPVDQLLWRCHTSPRDRDSRPTRCLRWSCPSVRHRAAQPPDVPADIDDRVQGSQIPTGLPVGRPSHHRITDGLGSGDAPRRIPCGTEQQGAAESRGIGSDTDAIRLSLSRLWRRSADTSARRRRCVTKYVPHADLRELMSTTPAELVIRRCSPITDEAARLERLTSDLSNATRETQEGSTISLDSTHSMLRTPRSDGSVADTRSRLIEASEVQLHVNTASPVEIYADAGQAVAQILVNVVGNSLAYTPTGRTVTVSLRSDSANAVVRIADNGRGISQTDLVHVLKRFNQVRRSHALASSRLTPAPPLACDLRGMTSLRPPRGQQRSRSSWAMIPATPPAVDQGQSPRRPGHTDHTAEEPGPSPCPHPRIIDSDYYQPSDRSTSTVTRSNAIRIGT